jgi:hypothetical protein
MITKICFKCNTEKSIDSFYKHPKMADGRLNKCKDCNKKDVRDNYDVKAQDMSFIEKERARSKEKYHRLNYKEKQKEWDSDKPWKSTSAYKNLRRDFNRKNKDILKTHDLHHWNYNNDYLKDFIVIERFNHKRAHKLMTLNMDSLTFIGLNNEILDTKQKHIQYLLDNGITF